MGTKSDPVQRDPNQREPRPRKPRRWIRSIARVATGAMARRGVAEIWVALALAIMVAAPAMLSIADRRAVRLVMEAESRPKGLEILPDPDLPFADPPTIRVRLGRFRQVVRLQTRSVQAAVADVAGGGAAETMDIIKLLELELNNGCVHLTPDDGFPRTYEPGQAVRLTPDGEPGKRWMRLAERRINGSVVVRPITMGATATEPNALEVVAEVPIEQYLPGVLHGELYQNWSHDAYRAQAVAARSYALHEMSRARDRGRTYDVEASQVDQAYAGSDVPKRAKEAAEATRGLVLETSDGQTLRAYYSSTCGGRAASAAEIWRSTGALAFNRATPLQPITEVDGGWAPGDCPCQWAPLHRWQIERDRATLARRLRAWGKQTGHQIAGLKSLRSIETDDVNAMGRPNHYRVTAADDETYTLRADELRVACNYSAAGLKAPSRKNRVNSNDLAFELTEKKVIIRGRGFGHGVGLCQYGAEGLARDGWRWRQIVERSYPGANLVRAYE